jgi:hypothetical protein
MNAIGALILTIVLLVVIGAPRRWALLGVVAGILYLTQGQQIRVLGLNLFALRFIELAGFARVMTRGEFSFRSLTHIDRSVLWLYSVITIIFLLRSSEGFAYQIGVAVDAFLCYFTFRGLLQGSEDYRWFLCTFLLLLVPYAVLILLEALTQRNVFASMGGIDYGSWIRDGRPRCQGSFRHPSLLGTLGATFIPLYIGLALTPKCRKLAVMGLVSCAAIVWASNSGGPASCAAVGIAGWLGWKARTRMKLVRRGTVCFVFLMALVMKAPIWYLIARVSSITGGDGWHRSYLMDVAFQHLGEWWLAGMPITQTNGWFAYSLGATGGSDITNQFIAFGLDAGLIGIGLFIILLVTSFKALGRALAAVRSAANAPPSTEYTLWGLGVMLVAHMFNWLGITYFDQTYAVWFLQLSVIAALTTECSRVYLAEAKSATGLNEEKPVAAAS